MTWVFGVFLAFELEVDHVLHFNLVSKLLEQFFFEVLKEHLVSIGTGIIFDYRDSNVFDVLFGTRLSELSVNLIEYLLVLALHNRVPVVFDVVIWATLENLGKFFPSIAVITINHEKHHLFLETPRILLYIWIEVVVPTLATLLRLLAWNLGCNLLPTLWTLLFNEVC